MRKQLSMLLLLVLYPLGVAAAPNDWLRTIRFAEGTSRYANPYGTAFSGKQFDNSKPHPGTTYCNGGYCSTAHGAYQFLYTTWIGVFGGKNPPMTSINQDLAAERLMRARAVLPSDPFNRHNVNLLAREWASLPTYSGYSYYGQPAKSYESLKFVFEQGKKERPKPPGLLLLNLKLKITHGVQYTHCPAVFQLFPGVVWPLPCLLEQDQALSLKLGNSHVPMSCWYPLTIHTPYSPISTCDKP